MKLNYTENLEFWQLINLFQPSTAIHKETSHLFLYVTQHRAKMG